MTAPAAAPEIQALLDVLAGALEPAIPVFDGKVTGSPAGQYVVVYAAPGNVSASRLCGQQRDLAGLVRITCCGPTRRDAQAAADTVRGALAGVVLDVPGRSCSVVVETPLNVPMLREDAVPGADDLPTFSVFTEYTWSSS